MLNYFTEGQVARDVVKELAFWVFIYIIYIILLEYALLKRWNLECTAFYSLAPMDGGVPISLIMNHTLERLWLF